MATTPKVGKGKVGSSALGIDRRLVTPSVASMRKTTMVSWCRLTAHSTTRIGHLEADRADDASRLDERGTLGDDAFVAGQALLHGDAVAGEAAQRDLEAADGEA